MTATFAKTSEEGCLEIDPVGKSFVSLSLSETPGARGGMTARTTCLRTTTFLGKSGVTRTVIFGVGLTVGFLETESVGLGVAFTVIVGFAPLWASITSRPLRVYTSMHALSAQSAAKTFAGEFRLVSRSTGQMSEKTMIRRAVIVCMLARIKLCHKSLTYLQAYLWKGSSDSPKVES